jgi:DUF438 domain-containing protein
MSEILNNSEKRKELLKHMILQLHSGEAPDLVRKRLAEILTSIPYDEVVEVEQELISEGLPVEEVNRFLMAIRWTLSKKRTSNWKR